MVLLKHANCSSSNMGDNLCLLVVTVLFLGLYSCTKDQTGKSASVDCVAVDATANTYNLRVGTVLNNSCGTATGCHDVDNYQSNGNVRFDTYETSKDGFLNKSALCTIKQTSGCVAMPQGAPKLADSLITYIQCWAENGYAQ